MINTFILLKNIQQHTSPLGLRTSEELVAGDKNTSSNSWGTSCGGKSNANFLRQICWRETIYRMTCENCCMTVRNSDSWRQSYCRVIWTWSNELNFLDFSFLLWKFRGLNGISIFKLSGIPSNVTGERMVVKLFSTPGIPSRKELHVDRL